MTLATYRRSAALTQERAADLLDVDVRTWRRWEARENMPTASQMVALADLLQLTYEELGRLVRWWGSR